MKSPNPIPLTLALAPFDRLETLSKVASRLDTLRASLEVLKTHRKSEDEKRKEFLEALRKKHPATNWSLGGPTMPDEREFDLQAEIDALQAVHDLADASTGDTIFLSTHAYSLLA